MSATNEHNFSMKERLNLETLRTLIAEGTVNEGVPRPTVTRQENGDYLAQLPRVGSARGETPIDALAALHDNLLHYYKRLTSGEFPLGENSRRQRDILETFLSQRACDCGYAPDADYCYCRGFCKG